MAEAKIAAPASDWARMSLAERALLQYEVEQFLYEEAALLDARRYRDWLGLIADDIHYWMPIRRTVTISDLDREFTKPGYMAFFDDDRELLEMRVKKLEAGSAWSEDPPSRSRHFVANVRITDVAGEEITCDVAFHLYRTRLESEVDSWVGRRTDVLRREGGGFRIVKRSSQGIRIAVSTGASWGRGILNSRITRPFPRYNWGMKSPAAAGRAGPCSTRPTRQRSAPFCPAAFPSSTSRASAATCSPITITAPGRPWPSCTPPTGGLDRR